MSKRVIEKLTHDHKTTNNGTKQEWEQSASIETYNTHTHAMQMQILLPLGGHAHVAEPGCLYIHTYRQTDRQTDGLLWEFVCRQCRPHHFRREIIQIQSLSVDLIDHLHQPLDESPALWRYNIHQPVERRREQRVCLREGNGFPHCSLPLWGVLGCLLSGEREGGRYIQERQRVAQLDLDRNLAPWIQIIAR